ncbi:MAG TPA: four helix bundle protein [Longimicrobiales bacterium]
MGFEHLRVYQAAMLLGVETDRIIAEIPGAKRTHVRDIVKHLLEAVNSIKHNVAEGNDSRYPGTRDQFFDIARGSGKEARSGFRSLVECGATTPNRAYRAIGLTMVIDKMLRGMSTK